MICVSAGHISFEKLINIIHLYDLVEVRLDLLSLNDMEYSEILKYSHKLIICYRNISTNLDESIQLIEKSINAGAGYIDIDVNEIEDHKSLINKIKLSNSRLILSIHNFDNTPSDFEINQQISEMRTIGPNIYKLCFKANSIEDIIRVQSLYQTYKDLNLIAFNLGELGSLSRIFALKSGAKFMYVAESEESKTESSQLTIKQLNKLFKIIET